MTISFMVSPHACFAPSLPISDRRHGGSCFHPPHNRSIRRPTPYCTSIRLQSTRTPSSPHVPQQPLPSTNVTSTSTRTSTSTSTSKPLPSPPSPSAAHQAVLHVLRQRASTNSKPGHRTDAHRVALCIEGGGMRGAISAGMVAALRHIGLSDAFDAIYGCSAGAIVGAYFVSGQVPHYGARIYYDVLCAPHTAGDFVELTALRNHPFVRRVFAPIRRMLRGRRSGAGVAVRSGGRSGRQYDANRHVLWLDRLIDAVMRHEAPLDWDAFAQRCTVQPLHPVATSLTTLRSHAFRGVEQSLDTLLERLRASACVPGIAGDAVCIGEDAFVDGLFFEPIPFRSAVADGATHVVVLRTKGWGTRLPKRAGVYEWGVATPCLRGVAKVVGGGGRWCDRLVAYLRGGGHIKAYRRSVAVLKRGFLNRLWGTDDDKGGEEDGEGGNAVILTVVPKDGDMPSQLERCASVVFEGVRTGFAAAYEVFAAVGEGEVSDSGGAGSGVDGRREARRVFTDEEIGEVVRKHEALRGRRRGVWRRCRGWRWRRRVRMAQGWVMAMVMGLFGRRRVGCAAHVVE